MSWYSNLIRKMRNKEITSVSVNELIEACDILNDGGNSLLRNNGYYHFVYMANALTGLMNNNATNLSAAISKSKSFAKGDDVTLDDEQKAKLNALLECAVTESNGSLTLKGCSKMNSLVDAINKAKEKAEKEKQEEEEKLKKEAEKMAEEAAKQADEANKADNGDEPDEKLKAGNVSGKANDTTEEERRAEEALSSVVDNTIRNIMSVYAMTYQPLFLNPPKGILYTNENGKGDIMAIGRSGDKTDKENVRVHGIPSLSIFSNYIYKAILGTCDYIKEAPKEGDHGMFIKASWMLPDGTMTYNYAPHIQIRNCMGVYLDKDTNTLKRAKTWSEFSSKLKSDIKPTIYALLKRVNIKDDDVVRKAMQSIIELYTTIITVNEFDSEKAVRLTIYSMTGTFTKKNENIAQAIVNDNPFSKTSLAEYQIMNNSESKNGVREILIVTNADMYRGEINFAYKTLGKLVNAGGKINLSHTIVGTNLSGNAVELNLNDNGLVTLGIVAGKRSGKGVLTMSLIASMLAAGSPVVYLDHKPDMAAIFWQFDRQLNTHTLAIDGAMNNFEGRVTPVRNYKYGYGANKEVAEKFSAFNLLPYIKGVQLMNIVGKMRVAGKIDKSKKAFFILDEAQVCGAEIVEAFARLEAAEKAFKPKGKDTPSEAYKYVCALRQLFESTETTAMDFLNANGGLGNMCAVILGQQPDATLWKGPFCNLIKKCSVKFLGNETEGGSQFGLSNDKNKWIKGQGLLGRGYFALCRGNLVNQQNTEMIKTTLVLNEADYNPHTGEAGTFTGALLKNITNEEIKEYVKDNDLTVSENNEIARAAGLSVGEANDLVGFPGLIKYIGSMTEGFSMDTALNAGYDLVYKALNILGIVGPNCPYDNVEAYMYSGKIDSIFTSGQLMKALENNMTIYEYLQNGVSDDGDGRILDGDGADRADGDDELIGFGAGFGTGTTTNSANTTNNTSEVATNNVVNSFGNTSSDESNVKSNEGTQAVNNETEAVNISNNYVEQASSDPFNNQFKAADLDKVLYADEEQEFISDLDESSAEFEGLNNDPFMQGEAQRELSSNIDNGMHDGESSNIGMDGNELSEDQISISNAEFTTPVAQKSKECQFRELPNGKTELNISQLNRGGAECRKLVDDNLITIDFDIPPQKMKKILNSDRKFKKFERQLGDSIIDGIAKKAGGRLMVRALYFTSGGVTLNPDKDGHTKILATDMLQYTFNSLTHIIDFEDIFAEFTNLTVLGLDKAMYEEFEAQIFPCITDADIADGITDAAYFVLKHKAKLNEIIVKDFKPFRKADLLEKERKESMRVIQERQQRLVKERLKESMNNAKKARKMKVETGTKITPAKTASRRKAILRGGRRFGRGVWKLTKGIGRGLFKLFT